MQVRFLLDENLAPYLKIALQRYDENIDVLRVGDEGAPPLSTPDPDILSYVEATRRFLVTSNRSSIPAHLETHWAAGGRMWGIAWIRPGAPLRRVVEDLYAIWGASKAEDWLNCLEWIPFYL
jgi:hypothetical protein